MKPGIKKKEAEKMCTSCTGAGSTSGKSEDEVVIGCGGSIMVHENPSCRSVTVPVWCFVRRGGSSGMGAQEWELRSKGTRFRPASIRGGETWFGWDRAKSSSCVPLPVAPAHLRSLDEVQVGEFACTRTCGSCQFGANADQ